MAYNGPKGIGADILERIRDFPEGAIAEDAMRELMAVGLGGDASDGIRSALDYLYRIMNDHGPFDGIIGYSEGATVAATLLLDEQQRFEKEGRLPNLRCAVFFAGWPPVTEKGAMVLADESDLVLDVPTCHVVGCQDPYLPGSIALYNICNPDTACIFDHGKGHTLPRDKRTVKELCNAIRKLIVDAS